MTLDLRKGMFEYLRCFSNVNWAHINFYNNGGGGNGKRGRSLAKISGKIY